MAIAIEAIQEARINYHTLPEISIARSLSIESVANPHSGKLTDLCLQALERSRIQVYENGHEPYVPAGAKNIRYFTTDPLTGRRVNEVPAEQMQTIPMHMRTEDGQGIIPVKEVRGKKGIEYWQLDETGKPITESCQPKKVSPEQVNKRRVIDILTGEEVKGYAEREILKEEIGGLVAFHFKDIIEGPQTREDINEWSNAYAVVPEIINLISDPTAYIEAVQKSHALNIVSAALQIARNPNTRVKIVSGFGASNTERSNCYAANAFPALKMADKIRCYFEQRELQGNRGLTHAPIVELVFAQEAGIEANFKNEAEYVRSQMAKNMDHVQKIAEQLYPEVPLIMNQDIPWSELTPQTSAVIEEDAAKLRDHPSETIRETIDCLVKFGDGKGANSSTIETATKYAAAHRFVWGLKPDYIATRYLREEVAADVVIRIGPRAETRFDAMIMAIRQREQIILSANGYQPTAEDPTTIFLIGDIGRQGPTYFRSPYDRPEGYSLEKTITELQEEANALTALIEQQPKSSYWAERSARRSRIEDLRAYQAIIRTRSSRIALFA